MEKTFGQFFYFLLLFGSFVLIESLIEFPLRRVLRKLEAVVLSNGVIFLVFAIAGVGFIYSAISLAIWLPLELLLMRKDKS